MRRAVCLLTSVLCLLTSTSWSRDQLFSYTNVSATKVRLAGEFNNWSGVDMVKSGSTFTVTLPLAPGTYAYKLVVDDVWMVDPGNSATKTVNGIANSAITVTDVPPAVRLTGATPTADAAVTKSFYIDPLTANTTVTIANLADGDTILIRARQANTGGPYTIGFTAAATVHWQAQNQPALSTTAGQCDSFTFHNSAAFIMANASQNY